MELFILQIVGVVPPGGSLEVFVPEGVRPGAARVGEGRARHVRLQRRIRKEDRTGRKFMLKDTVSSSSECKIR